MKLSEEFTIFVGKTNGAMCNGLERLSISSFNDNASKILNSIENLEEKYKYTFNECQKYLSEKEELKRQLEEKDKEIECWKKLCETYKQTNHNFLDEELKVKEKINQKAIEELDNILELFAMFENKDKDTIICYNDDKSFLEYLVNRIKELKGEK